ncbi:MAG: sulfatase-like hydrolase/transferase [Bacteroidetes bacterium]|nr:sulfatase-like hydrolase/transferase [Bacteroidota bacterium]
MKIRTFVTLLTGLLVFQKIGAQQANLLFVFTDQQSYDMVGYYEGSQAITPHVDQLASEGISFNHAISNSPLCTPHRGMLMTGQHPLYNGCFTNDVPLLPNKGTSFAQALNEAGYETAYVGKWHLYGGGNRDTGIPSGENRHGFNGTFLSNNCTVDFSPEACFYWNDNNEKVYFKDEYKDSPWELEGQTRQAEKWLRDYEDDKPFAMFVSWHPPHDFVGDGCADIPERQYNYDVSELDPDLIDPYKDMDIELRADLKSNPSMFDCRKKQYRNYLAMVTACDEAFGRLIQILKDKDVYEKTLIVFTSDHGDLIGSHRARIPKLTPQDYSCRVPLVISGKYVLPQSRKSDLLIGTMDIMPTVLGFLDVEIPESVQGMDLSEEILSGIDDAVESQPLFMYAARHYRGVYTKDWTYTFAVDEEFPGGSTMHNHDSFIGGADIEVLYDRENDPAQLHNYFGDKKHRKIQKELHKATLEWMNKYGDKGYSETDFLAVYTWKEWQKNYDKRPIDLLNKN